MKATGQHEQRRWHETRHCLGGQISRWAVRPTLRWIFLIVLAISAMTLRADETNGTKETSETNAPPKLTPEQVFEGGEIPHP